MHHSVRVLAPAITPHVAASDAFAALTFVVSLDARSAQPSDCIASERTSASSASGSMGLRA